VLDFLLRGYGRPGRYSLGSAPGRRSTLWAACRIGDQVPAKELIERVSNLPAEFQSGISGVARIALRGCRRVRAECSA